MDGVLKYVLWGLESERFTNPGQNVNGKRRVITAIAPELIKNMWLLA